MKKIKIISIIGPTSVGKTKLAVTLAKKLGAEIISADSIQIYKEFNILSAKPSKDDLKSVSHYLIDVLSVEESYSVARFVSEAKECIEKVVSKNKVPFLVGGTGLYIDSLLKNINFSLSEKKQSFDINLSNSQMMQMLIKVDPISASRIHINDSKRLRRALEFFEIHSYPISKQVENSQQIESPFDVCKIGLNFSDRKLLYSKINTRVDEMLSSGALEEVEKISLNKNISKTAYGTIGYKEILKYLNKEKTLEETSEEIKKLTRRYAKRQLTWFRKDNTVNWIYLDDFNSFSEVLKQAENIIKKFLYDE